jgi:hypothetical protein
MAPRMELRSFYFAHPGLYVVPVEELRRDGVTPEYEAVLLEERGTALPLLAPAMQRYWDRLEWMWARTQRSWFPPRFQNLCLVADPILERPYWQPFAGSSWLLYESDFEPATSSVELATFLMVLAERLGIANNMKAGVLQCISWFLLRTPEELDDFREGARRCTRPDAEAYRALADALPWILEIYHVKFRPPFDLDAPRLHPLRGMEMLVPVSRTADLERLVNTFETVGARVIESYRQAQAAPTKHRDPIGLLVDFLRERKPRVIVVDRDRDEVWDPDHPDAMARLRPALDGLTERSAESLCADLDLVDRTTQRFFAAVNDRDALPTHGEEVEQEGGAYLHASRGLMVYALAQPGLDTLREQAPPYHRLLLAARTMHEWGHVATDAGLVAFDESQHAARTAALDEAGEIYDAIIARATPAQIEGLADELARRPGGHSLGRALAEVQLGRMGDYMANLISRALLPIEPMEAYVRANIRSLARQPTSLVRRLARHSYEYQYLSLSRMRDPEAYFLGSTWFGESYVRSNICTLDEARRLFAAMARVCGGYRLDRARLNI